MIASSPLNHIFISPLKTLVDSSQEKLKKKKYSWVFCFCEVPRIF